MSVVVLLYVVMKIREGKSICNLRFLPCCYFSCHAVYICLLDKHVEERPRDNALLIWLRLFEGRITLSTRKNLYPVDKEKLDVKLCHFMQYDFQVYY